MELTHYESWQDRYASTSILAADPALLLEALQEQAERTYDRLASAGRISASRDDYRRTFVGGVYAGL